MGCRGVCVEQVGKWQGKPGADGQALGAVPGRAVPNGVPSQPSRRPRRDVGTPARPSQAGRLPLPPRSRPWGPQTARLGRREHLQLPRHQLRISLYSPPPMATYQVSPGRSGA